MNLKLFFLGFGIALFLLGLIYVITYYANGKGTLEDCRKQHRMQAWIMMIVGIILLIIWGILNYFFGSPTQQYYY